MPSSHKKISESRRSRAQMFGIDCCDSLCFRPGTWKPGGEYKKKLTIKNLSTKVIKVKYELPETKFFSMDFPEVITLSPGVHVPLEIVFRPIVYEEYYDFVTFKTENGKFKISVSAQVAKMCMDFPKSIEFNNCPVNEILEKKIVLHNTGQVPSDFEFSCESPFDISPSVGSIKAGKTQTLTCTFSPVKASVWTTRAVCKINNGEQIKICEISGTGKYPFLSFADRTSCRVEFGDVLVGSPKEKCQKTIRLENRSEIAGSFVTRHVESDVKPRFEIRPNRGVVLPNSFVDVVVTYLPVSTGTYACDNFDFITPGGNCPRLTCTGTARGPCVSIYTADSRKGKEYKTFASMNFGDVKVGRSTRRVLYLRNDSKLPATFQFDAEQNGVFRFNRVSGVIPPQLEVYVNLTFQSDVSGNFYKRVFCMIEHQAPVYVDLIATAFQNQTSRPAPLLQRHVNAFRRRAQLGYSKLSPDHVVEMMKSSQIMNKKFHEPEERKKGTTISGESTERDVAYQREYFNSKRRDPTSDVLITEEEVNFGTSSNSGASTRTIHVKNNTNAKIVCRWFVNNSSFKKNDDEDDDFAFEVIPRELDVRAQETVEFKVVFRPSRGNHYYCKMLEAHCFFKEQRNFRLVDDAVLTPPWNLHVRALGHTFSHSEQFVPNCRLHFEDVVEFPAAYVGHTVYRTVKMSNESNTPCQYRFVRDDTGCFDIRPSAGQIAPGEYQLAIMSFCPKRIGRHRVEVGVIFNNASQQQRNFALSGLGTEPKLCLQSNATMFMKPTCVGILSQRTFEMSNTSRVPLRYVWHVPAKFRDMIKPCHTTGVIKGNETFRTTWTFSPRETNDYAFNIPCIVYAHDDQDDENKIKTECTQQVKMSLRAQGTTGALQFTPSLLDFKTILQGTKRTKTLTLTNNSDCTLKYELKIVPESRVEGMDLDHDGVLETNEIKFEEEQDNLTAIKFSKTKGTIHARTKQQLHVRFEPSSRGHYRYRIFWKLTSDEKTYAQHDRALLSCSVKGHAGYPHLCFDEIGSYDKDASPRWMRPRFSLDKLNESLRRPPQRAHDDVVGEEDPETLETFSFDFMPRVIDSKASIVMLRLKNTSHLPVSYRFLFPRDLQVEVEPWADAGEPTAEQIKINQVLDMGLFRVTPRKGTLEPGSSHVISFSYLHVTHDDRLGDVHSIPIVLDIHKGNKMRILLRGRTIPRKKPHLLLPSTDVNFSKVQIGQDSAVVCTVPVYNASDVPVRYDMDTKPFETLKLSNYDFNVLDAIENTTSGIVRPQETTDLMFAFRPLEAKTYELATSISYVSAEAVSRRASMNNDNSKRVSSLKLLLSGEGTCNDVNQVMKEEEDQMLILPGQPATLHIKHLHAGKIPVGSKTSRLVVMSGLVDKDVEFSWCANHPLIRSGTIQINPMKGVMERDENVVFKFTFNSSNKNATRLCGDLVLEVKPQGIENIQSNSSIKKKKKKNNKNNNRESVITRSTASHEQRVADISKTSAAAGLEVSIKQGSCFSAFTQHAHPEILATPRECTLHLCVRAEFESRDRFQKRGGVWKEYRSSGSCENKDEEIVVEKRRARYYIQMIEEEEEENKKQGEPDRIFETFEEEAMEDLNLLKDSSVQDLCMKCLEETILNIVDEAANGEFRLDELPKAYVVRQLDDS